MTRSPDDPIPDDPSIPDDASIPDDPSIPDDVQSVLGRLELPPVPSELTQRLLDVFRAALPVVPAELMHDTRGELGLAGARGGAGSAWTMSYGAEPWDIVLDVVPHGRRLALTGQFLGPGATPTWIRAFRDDELVAIAVADEHGQFDLGLVERATYSIVVPTPMHLIELSADLEAGEER
jgi:hypothetical protein